MRQERVDICLPLRAVRTLHERDSPAGQFSLLAKMTEEQVTLQFSPGGEKKRAESTLLLLLLLHLSFPLGPFDWSFAAKK